jgi:2-amino-4-hydroxy-6-hydroxymethyldihydropteridine diphosphokinase
MALRLMKPGAHRPAPERAVIDVAPGVAAGTAADAAAGAAADAIVEPQDVAVDARSQRAYVGLGANLGDPLVQLRNAVAALGRLPGTCVAAVSSVYRSAPVGYLDQPDFLNAVAALDTRLSPQALLDALLAIEQDGGRTRAFRNAPRLIDLDLLLYGERVVDEEHLTVPHPRMSGRAFVLLPLAELDPACVVPGAGPLSTLAEGVSGQAIECIGPLVAG